MALTFGLWDNRGADCDSIGARLDRWLLAGTSRVREGGATLCGGRGRAYGRGAGSLGPGGDDAGVRLHAAAIGMSGQRLLGFPRPAAAGRSGSATRSDSGKGGVRVDRQKLEPTSSAGGDPDGREVEHGTEMHREPRVTRMVAPCGVDEEDVGARWLDREHAAAATSCVVSAPSNAQLLLGRLSNARHHRTVGNRADAARPGRGSARRTTPEQSHRLDCRQFLRARTRRGPWSPLANSHSELMNPP
jgi:hypothetical protein